jgi:hypothetical protein
MIWRKEGKPETEVEERSDKIPLQREPKIKLTRSNYTPGIASSSRMA